MTFDILLQAVRDNKYLRTQLDLVAYLIGYKGFVDWSDFEEILRLYKCGMIE